MPEMGSRAHQSFGTGRTRSVARHDGPPSHLGRPLGRITQARGPGFIIEPHERAYVLMAKVPSGPFVSFEDALRAIEKHLHGACRLTPDQR